MTAGPALPLDPAPPRHRPRAAGAIRAAVVVALGALAFVLVSLPPVPMCAFKLWTGLPCPGCGMTRACVSLAHGDVVQSFRFHPMGLVLALGALSVFLGGLHAAATGRDPVWSAVCRHGGRLGLLAVVSLLGLWLTRTFVVPAWSAEAASWAPTAGR